MTTSWRSSTSHPIARGHTLVIPKEPAATLDQLSDDAAAAIGRVLPRIARAVLAATGATAFNVLQNNGTLAHQAVLHVHFHVIPKHDDDGPRHRLAHRHARRRRGPRQVDREQAVRRPPRAGRARRGSSLGSGCLYTTYVAQAAHGQFELLGKAKPLDEGRSTIPTTPLRTAMLLAEIPAIKQYGRSYGLQIRRNYDTYADARPPRRGVVRRRGRSRSRSSRCAGASRSSAASRASAGSTRTRRSSSEHDARGGGLRRARPPGRGLLHRGLVPRSGAVDHARGRRRRAARVSRT